jgi:hypothetical protein
MRKKDTYLKQRTDKKLIVRHHVLQALIVFMFVIVLHDSFRHQTPFYYICFLLLGLLIGRIFSITDRVKHGGKSATFMIAPNAFSLVITLLLLSIRFVWGRPILEFADVMWTTDALYLFFIGIYWSKLKSIVRQMDEVIYGWLRVKEDPSNID